MIALPPRVLDRPAPPARRSRLERLTALGGGTGLPPWARRYWLAMLCGCFAVFAAITALVSVNAPERRWGLCATAGYTAAAVAAVVTRRRAAAVLTGLAGGLLVPLTWLVVTGLGQPEVGVISRSAALFLHRGTPYHGVAELASAHGAGAYDPYLPALVMFGLPRALAAVPLTDPRIGFGLVFAASFTAALAAAGVRRPGWCAAAAMASPVIALPLSVGGDDLPVLGLMCLGLAIAGGTGVPGRAAARWRSDAARWRPDAARWGADAARWRPSAALRRPDAARLWRGAARWRPDAARWWPGAAGLVMGLAAAMKPTAWPVLGVVLVLVAARGGRRAAGWFCLAAAAVAAGADGATLAAQPGAAWVNTVLFPLGLAKVASPAASSLPGHLMAATWGGAGHAAALALLLAACLAIAWCLLTRPPTDAQAAGWWAVLGLTAAFLLAPASRAGYFTYPLGLAEWLLLTRAGGLPAISGRERPGSGSGGGR
jgi:hypothetical protein